MIVITTCSQKIYIKLRFKISMSQFYRNVDGNIKKMTI